MYQPMKVREAASSYDTSPTAISSQVREEAPVEVVPQVPPTAATRTHTTVRPVYDDFATAHSSITSRSAYGGSRDTLLKSPNKQGVSLSRNGSPPRRTLKSIKRQKGQPKDKALAIPTPAMVSNHLPISELDFDIPDARLTSGRQHECESSLNHSPSVAAQDRSSGSTFLGGLKKAMGGKSSPVAKTLQRGFSLSIKWPRDSIELSGSAQKIGQPTGRGSEEDQVETGSAQQLVKYPLPKLPFYVDDPFIYDASRHQIPIERAGTERHETFGDKGQNLQNATLPDNNQPGAGVGDSPYGPRTQSQETLNYLQGGNALAIGSQLTLTREGSTVDDIVRQYARNNELWDISLDSNDEDREEDEKYFQHPRMQNEAGDLDLDRSDPGFGGCIEVEKPFRASKLMDSSGITPSAILPQIPSLADQQTLKFTSDGSGKSQPCGNTHDVLGVTQCSQCVTTTDPPVSKDRIAHPHVLTVPSSTNPFRHGPNRNFIVPSVAAADSSPDSRISQTIGAGTSDNTEKLAGMPLLTLERDVSRALRRMSVSGSSSQESPSHCLGDGGFQSSTDSSGLLSFIGKPIKHTPEPINLNPRGFYHTSAIRQTWVDSQHNERVRIPIRRDVIASSLPLANSASPTTDEFDLEELDELNQNDTEWETIMDGVMSRAKTVGSSLANNSSTGNISPIFYKHDDFSSTDRIIQHPAQIDYSHDYRHREIKEGNFPILLPSYKPHTVNGFPANSYRSIGPFQQSSSNLYQPPPPLCRSHKNPFRSPPPEVITNNSKSSGATDQDGILVSPPPRLKLGKLQTANWDNSAHWMDGFGDPGPAIRPAAPTLNLRSHNLSALSLSDSYPGSQIAGSSIADASSSALSTIIHELNNSPDIPKDAILKFDHAADYIDDKSTAARQRVPFIKGPPGAFYQGVRSQPDSRRKNLPVDRKANPKFAQRKSAQEYPTNQIRPLSLLQVQNEDLVAGGDRHQPGGRLNDDYLYSSPLAPIKSKSWYSLYTKEQLSSMHTDAKIESNNRSGYLSRRSSHPAFGQALKLHGSWKRTWSPHLHPWPRDDSSAKIDLSGRKVKISSIIFGLCCLFPPMLVLYGVGYLDNMILWITKGEISSFSKAHKKAALQLVCLFIAVILIAAPIVVTVKVVGSK